jgi:hypothetical protein
MGRYSLDWKVNLDESLRIGIYEYRGEHAWTSRGGKRASEFFYVGMWS